MGSTFIRSISSCTKWLAWVLGAAPDASSSSAPS